MGPPKGHKWNPENLLQHGVLPPHDYSSCQEPAPAQASHGVTASFGHSSSWVLRRLYRWMSTLPWISMDCRSTAASPRSAPWPEGEFQQQNLLPPLLCWPWCQQRSSSHIFSFLFSLLQKIFSFLNCIFPEAVETSQGLSLGKWLVSLRGGWHWLCWT